MQVLVAGSVVTSSLELHDRGNYWYHAGAASERSFQHLSPAVSGKRGSRFNLRGSKYIMPRTAICPLAACNLLIKVFMSSQITQQQVQCIAVHICIQQNPVNIAFQYKQ